MLSALTTVLVVSFLQLAGCSSTPDPSEVVYWGVSDHGLAVGISGVTRVNDLGDPGLDMFVSLHNESEKPIKILNLGSWLVDHGQPEIYGSERVPCWQINASGRPLLGPNSGGGEQRAYVVAGSTRAYLKADEFIEIAPGKTDSAVLYVSLGQYDVDPTSDAFVVVRYSNDTAEQMIGPQPQVRVSGLWTGVAVSPMARVKGKDAANPARH